MPAPRRRASYYDAPIRAKQSQSNMNNTSITHSVPNKRRSKTMDRNTSDSLNLDAVCIQYIFKEVIPEYSTDEELIDEAFILHKMIDSLSYETRQWPSEFLENIVTELSTFVNVAPTLPPNFIGEIHTITGLIRLQQREYNCAIKSLQKALWLKSSLRESSTEIGMALHRLAVAYGRSGNLVEAVTLLEKALFKYEQGGWSKTHPHAVTATTMIERYSLCFAKIVLEKYTNSTATINSTSSPNSPNNRSSKNSRNRQSFCVSNSPQRRSKRPSYTSDTCKSMTSLVQTSIEEFP